MIKILRLKLIADAGLDDELIDYMNTNNLKPSDIGLSEKVVKNYWNAYKSYAKTSKTSNKTRQKAFLSKARSYSSKAKLDTNFKASNMDAFVKKYKNSLK